MRSKFFILFRLVILCLLFTSGGCSGGGGGDSDGGEGDGNVGSGWVTIEQPSTSSYTTQFESAYLSGEAFISPTGWRCCTGSASDTGVTVTYTNAYTGLSGRVSQRAEYCWFFGQRLCGHSWSASVALGMGDNDITITSTDGYNEGRDSIRITRLREFTPPTVISTIPANGAVDVPINTAITATFSEQMDASTIDEDSFTLMDGVGNPIIGSVTYQNKTATFRPNNNLDGFTTYTATITTMVRDLSGNRMTATYLWNFSTDPNPDTIPPSVIQEYPADASSCSDIDTAIFVTFSEDMDSSSLSIDSFTLTDSSSNPIRGDVEYNIYNNKFAFKPHYNLSYSETYTATVTTSVKDLYGHNMESEYIWSFSTLSSGSGTWQPISTINAPDREFHTAVWTGTEMIIWGGQRYDGVNPVRLNTGSRYDPLTDTWQPISTTNAPSERFGHTAVWTGTEMIVWGGFDGFTFVNTGGKYNPVFDTWQPISTTNAPPARSGQTAVWTGTEMIVWGGSYMNTGSRYDPLTDTWQPISTTNAPAMISHTAIWTGREMIIWGKSNSPPYQQIGSRYDPLTDTWQTISTTNAPSERSGHTAVWTGTEMIVWGGYHVGPDYLNTGGRYDPITDTWQPTSIECTPTGRTSPLAVWTGSEMIVWGGNDGGHLYTGGKYDPSTDSWLITDHVGQPTSISGMTVIWTGSEMIIWGGDNGGRYQP